MPRERQEAEDDILNQSGILDDDDDLDTNDDDDLSTGDDDLDGGNEERLDDGDDGTDNAPPRKRATGPVAKKGKKDAKEPKQDDQQYSQQPDDQAQGDPFDPRVRLSADREGNLYHGKKLIARAGRERTMFEKFRNRAGQSDQAAMRMAQRTLSVVEESKKLYADYVALQKQKTILDDAGLNPEEQLQVIAIAKTYKADPVAGIKKMLTTAAANGIDMKQFGVGGAALDAASLAEIIDKRLSDRLKPVLESAEDEKSQQANEAASLEEAREFYGNYPDALDFAERMGPQKFAAYMRQAKRTFPKLTNGEIWLRTKMQLAQVAQRRAQTGNGRRPATGPVDEGRQPPAARNGRRQTPQRSVERGIESVEEIGRQVLAELKRSGQQEIAFMAKPENILHAMATRSRKRLILAAVMSGGVFTYLAAKGRIKMEDGGPEMSNPLVTGDNPNVTTAKYYDTVPVEETSELSTVEYEMTRIVGSLIMSEQEADENQGDAVIVKILETKIKVLERAIKKAQRNFATSLNSGSDPNGLPNLILEDPTTGTVGGVNLANEPLFRNSSYDFNGTLNSGNIEEAFDDILLDLTTDDGGPTVIFVGRNILRMHRAAARDKTQIALSDTGFGKQLINLGIKGTTHQGIPMIYDETLDPDDFYFVNEEFLNIHVLKSANMKLKQLTAPWNVDAIGRRYIYEYQLASWNNYRTHAFGTND